MSGDGAHRSAGLHRLLELPAVYRLLQHVAGATRSRRVFVADFIRGRAGDRVLDVGCGPADLLAFLPPGVIYTGYDLNPRYIELARRRYGERGRFLVGRAATLDDGELGGPFDRVLLVALLHHLEDDEARMLLAQAARLLAPDGVVVTFDNVRYPGQSRAARWIIDRDRGGRVRSPQAYTDLLHTAFPAVESVVREDLLRIPYSHFIARAAATPEALSRR
jgi:SAM-dependent methyltransferase